MPQFELDAAAAQLLVVDVQERLLPHICDEQRVLAQIVRMLRTAPLLGLPITICEQYPKGLGSTAAAIRDVAGQSLILSKMTFSAGRDAGIARRLTEQGRPTVLLVGIETHVCVQQTAWDLLERGLRPVLLADAVGSRNALDHEVALDGLRAGGMTVTTCEAALYRMMDQAGTDLFRRMLPLIKGD